MANGSVDGLVIPDKLMTWQARLAESDREFGNELRRMNDRERLYAGDNTLRPLVPGDVAKGGGPKHTSHVRNIIFENIEAQISSSIPQPKVTPRRKSDEPRADIIENFIRNELDRMPFEMYNDIAERTVPIQGAVAWLVEWDNSLRTHSTVGELAVNVIHPKQLAPQPGVFTGINDMDWIIIKVPSTKEAVRRKYGVSVEFEGEAEPEVRSVDGGHRSDDAVTQYVGYARNDNGGIDLFTWVNDVVLEDLPDYQSRKSDEGDLEYEEFSMPFTSTGGIEIAPEEVFGEFDEFGFPAMRPARVPYYVPGMYPIVLQRSVTVHGQLLGNSDVDIMQDQQNTVNRLEQKIIDRLIKAGTRITLPDRAELRISPEDGERWYIKPEEKQMIDVYQFSGDVSAEMAFLAGVYEEARQVIGITDSFQGRKDSTATSGKAKEFAAAQSAGRLESKRAMKDAAYADLFELLFKFALAYSDEPRSVVYKNSRGENEYLAFDRYDFLERDENGDFYWNDQFLFATDTSAPLASNREAMWQETRLNLQTGAFGDPSQTETLILFWDKMEDLHYPGAGLTKKFLEEKMEREKAEAAMAAQGPGALGGPGGGLSGPDGGAVGGLPGMAGAMAGGGAAALGDGLPGMAGAAGAPGVDVQGMPADLLPPQLINAIERQAREDAARAAQSAGGASRGF